MSLGYGTSDRFAKLSLFVAVGAIVIPLSVHLHSATASSSAKTGNALSARDPRATRLHSFLAKLRCPIAGLSDDFIRVADENHLDWRLLPSIAVVESGGGKAYKNNNVFGWNGGEQGFSSIRSGMELVAFKLGNSALYRRHDSLGKLRIYNDRQEYADSVIAVMNRICPPTLRLYPVAPTVM